MTIQKIDMSQNIKLIVLMIIMFTLTNIKVFSQITEDSFKNEITYKLLEAKKDFYLKESVKYNNEIYFEVDPLFCTNCFKEWQNKKIIYISSDSIYNFFKNKKRSSILLISFTRITQVNRELILDFRVGECYLIYKGRFKKSKIGQDFKFNQKISAKL